MSDMEQSGVKKKKKRLRKGRVFLLLIFLIGILCGGFMAGMGLYDRFSVPMIPCLNRKRTNSSQKNPFQAASTSCSSGKMMGTARI